MNIVDIIIIILVILALLRGQELGFIRQLCSTVGLFGGLMLGAWIEPHLISQVHTPLSRLAVTLATIVGSALIVLGIGETIGLAIKRKVEIKNGLNHIDNSLGAGLGGLSILALVWLSSSILATLPYPSLQSAIQSSKIVAFVKQDLPAAPNLVADIGHFIVPNGFPNVFIGTEPSPRSAILPNPAALATAVTKDRASVVKIEGQGCGGIVEGSGFVISTDLIATNAHVVAGIATPFVIDETGSHRAVAIWFDPNLDFAILRVRRLTDPTLSFNTSSITHGTPSGVLGYPGGGPFQANSAAVLDEFTAVGRNIYNQGNTQRDVYSIRATVVPGNSGGPLVDLSGDVIGVVFATSTIYHNVGYALSAPELVSEITQAEAINQPVSTGSCAE